MVKGWRPEDKVKEKVVEYLKHLDSTYPSFKKKSIVTSRKTIKKRCAPEDLTLADNVIDNLDKEGVLELFSKGNNPTYKIDLKKARNYLHRLQKGSE